MEHGLSAIEMTFAEILSRKAMDTFKNFPRFAAAHCILKFIFKVYSIKGNYYSFSSIIFKETSEYKQLHSFKSFFVKLDPF